MAVNIESGERKALVVRPQVAHEVHFSAPEFVEPGFVLLDARPFPVVEASPPQLRLVEVEAERVDEVQVAAGLPADLGYGFDMLLPTVSATPE